MTQWLNTLANLIQPVYLAGAGSGTGGRFGDFFHTVFVIECADGDRLYRRVCEE